MSSKINGLSKVYKLLTALLILVAASALAYFYQSKATKLPIKQYFPRDKIVALWDWSSVENRNPEDNADLADFLYLRQVNTIYLDIGYVSETNDPEKLTIFAKALNEYIFALSKKNIKVYAAGGHVDWSKVAQRDKPIKLANYVFAYNQTFPDSKFAGLEYDIESYNQQGFPEASFTEKSLVLTELLDTVDILTKKVADYRADSGYSDFDIGFAVPYWFDNENKNIPSVNWRDKTGPTIYHLIDALQKYGKGNIVVMSYRNAAIGNDGSIFHARTEVEYAKNKAPQVHVIIGQEVTDVEPSKITFYNQSTTELSNQVKIINDELSQFSSYGGIAINDLLGFESLDSK